MVKGAETRERVCQAAMRLADRDGLLNLTIDNVAAEAELSKGGILHHFPNKEALLLGVITHFSELIESSMTRAVADDPNPNYRWIRAMLALGGKDAQAKSIAGSSIGLTPESLDRFMLSILAVAVHHPELLKPIHAIGQRLRGRLTAIPEEGLEQLIMWLVADGLFLWRFVGLIQPNDPLIEQVMQALGQRLAALTETSSTATTTKATTTKATSTKATATKIAKVAKTRKSRR
jgi:AcrR family transcriptional regulator